MVMKYICPTCNKKFDEEEEVSKHFLKCWKENHSHHKSKSAPHSEDKNVVEINQELANFFDLLEGSNNERSNG